MSITQAVAMKAGKSADKVTSFVKSLAKNAPAIALTAAVLPDIMDFMKGLTEPFYETGEALEELGLTASEGFQEMAEDIADAIYGLQPVAESIGTWVGDSYDKIQAKDWDGLSTNVSTGLTNAWQIVVDFFSNTERMAAVGEGIASVVNGIGTFLKELTVEDMEDVILGFETAMKSFFTGVDWSGLFEGIWNGLQTFATGLSNRVEENLLAWYDSLEGDTKTFWETFFGVSASGGFGQ